MTDVTEADREKARQIVDIAVRDSDASRGEVGVHECLRFQISTALAVERRAALESAEAEIALTKQTLRMSEQSNDALEKELKVERQRNKEQSEKVKGLVEALEKIRSTNGLQYSDLFEICDAALSAFRSNEEGK